MTVKEAGWSNAGLEKRLTIGEDFAPPLPEKTGKAKAKRPEVFVVHSGRPYVGIPSQ